MYTSRPYHRQRTHAQRQQRPMVAFLLISCLGILFAGCSGPTEPTPETEEFVFTEEDVARSRELIQEAVQEAVVAGSGGQPLAVESQAFSGAMPVVDDSKAVLYEAIRAEPIPSGDAVYRVTNEFLNVRSRPDVRSDIVERLSEGDEMIVLEFVDAAWARVRLGELEGYVAVRYIAKLVTEPTLASQREEFAGQYFVDFGFLNVRKAPDTQSEKLGELPGQAIIRPISIDDVWARVPFEGKEGYVAVQYLSPFQPNFLIRQEQFTLPVLRYDATTEEAFGQFVTHVRGLQGAGFTFITLRDFADLLEQQEDRDVRLPPRRAVLAFSAVNTTTVPALLEAIAQVNVPVTVFLQTNAVGLRGVTEQQIINLKARGVDIQSATHTGDDLRALTSAQVELELKQSRALLEELTQSSVLAVQYPLGGVNDRIRTLAAEAGYLFGIGSAPDTAFSRSQLLRLPSIEVKGEMPVEEVLAIVEGGAALE